VEAWACCPIGLRSHVIHEWVVCRRIGGCPAVAAGVSCRRGEGAHALPHACLALLVPPASLSDASPSSSCAFRTKHSSRKGPLKQQCPLHESPAEVGAAQPVQSELTLHLYMQAGWLARLAQGLDNEEVKARLLPKSVGNSKTFRGRSALTTLPIVHQWLLSIGAPRARLCHSPTFTPVAAASHLVVRGMLLLPNAPWLSFPLHIST